jgi:hypothetical protein
MLERMMGTSTPANAPRDVKTTEKPATNRRIGRVFGRRAGDGTESASVARGHDEGQVARYEWQNAR